MLNQLLSLPDHLLAGAREAARRDENETVREYVVEAARLSPFPGVIWRYCEEDALVAQGTPRERRVAKGSLVGLFITAANVDPWAVSDPHVFRLGRPPEERLLFGHMHHNCLGEHIGMEIVTEVAKAMLARFVFRKLGAVVDVPSPLTTPETILRSQLRVQLVTDPSAALVSDSDRTTGRYEDGVGSQERGPCPVHPANAVVG